MSDGPARPVEGQPVNPGSGGESPFIAVDPRNGEVLSRHPVASPSEIERTVADATDAQRLWNKLPVGERATLLPRLADRLREERGRLAVLMSTEMGKPIAQSEAEIEKCALCCEYYAEHAAAALAPVPAATSATRSYWAYRPLGIVLGIMPWNFPAWQVMRFAAPQVTVGNAVLIKHAPSVPGTATELERIFLDAGYPPGIYSNVLADLDGTGALIDHPGVRAVSLTGSVRAGRSVAARTGRNVKKCVLELGGSDPAIVFPDADLNLAVEGCVWGRLQNTGQSCVATKRFVVVEEVRPAFEAALVTRMRATNVGDPLDPSTEVGPMARTDLRDELHRQVRASVEAGARCLLGGELPDGPGAWYPPTLLTDVVPGMPAYHEELFGPAAAVIGARDEADAVRIANDTPYGLGAAIYTADVERGERIALERLDAGNCFVNGIVRSDPQLPFGGTKDSGYGRELSPLGLTEFANVKTVWVE